MNVLNKNINSDLERKWLNKKFKQYGVVNKDLSTLKIICIGNVNVGGTGKTPIAIFIFKTLTKMGYKPVFLTSLSF